MNFQYICLLSLVTLLLLATVSPGNSANNQRTILFGVNYLSYVTSTEDFSPYWVTNNWTENRMTADLKIMKSIGCSAVRFHIYPILLGEGTSSGIAADRFRDMLDLGVKVAYDLGLKIHLDICGDVEEHGEERVKYCLNRYKGRIESYQIENERFDYPESPEKLTWLQSLYELAHSIDPKAKMSADFLATDWVRIRKEMPDLYKQLDLVSVHYYPVTDYRGWNELYISDLVDHLGSTTNRKLVGSLTLEDKLKFKDFNEYDAKAQWFDHGMYNGSLGSLDKEIWISEISSHGYWRWGNLTPEDKRANDWQKMIDAVAGAKNRVTRMYHHCFRDKMSWREFGMGQSGIVYYDGAPRAATFAFKKMAVKYSPQNSPMRVVDCEIPRVVVPDGAKTVSVKIKLTNKTAKALKGQLTFEESQKNVQAPVDFNLAPKAIQTLKFQVDVDHLIWGNNHVFARVNIPQGLAYGWGVVANPKRMMVNTADAQPAIPVDYVNGIGAVQEFLDKYGDDCAIITGPGLGNDAEMGYRLKIVLQAMRCREVQVRPSILAQEVLNRPLIVIGDPMYNQISRTVEMALPEDQRITATNPGLGKGMINVVNAPFGKMEADAGRFSRQAVQLGYYFGACPAALYISGSDDKGVKAAAYDLIRRIWGTEEKYR